MAIPFAAALIGGGGAQILDYALGRPLNLWGRSIDAEQTPTVRNAAYLANDKRPNILPAPDAIIECARRGMLAPDVAAWALQDQGIAWNPPYGQLDGMTNTTYTAYQKLWAQVGKMRRSRPDAATLSRLMVSERLPVDRMGDLTEGYDSDWGAFAAVTESSFAMPGMLDVLQLRRLGKISQADYDQALRQLGWFNNAWARAQEQVTPLPNLFTLMRDRFLGLVDENQYARWASALGHVDPQARARIEAAFYQIPSGPELVQLAVRDAWNQQVVDRWGYDAEFPEELLYWMRAQGWDWGQSFTDRNGRVVHSVHWPQLLWRAHWQVISPGQAYQAYRRLTPEAIASGRFGLQGLTPFTHDDLLTVLRVHDYPPAARDWLAALQSQPLRMLTIRTAYTLGVRGRAWAERQLGYIGYLADDASAILDTTDQQLENKRRAWIDREQTAQYRATYHEIIAGYDDGFVDYDTAISRMASLGVDEIMADQALRLADSRRLRSDLRQAIVSLRREYLSGSFLDGEVLTALAGYRVTPAAAARYLSRWQGLRTLKRRTATTAQILAWVRDGMLTAPTAQVRLANLGWAGGDALILVAEALHTLEDHEARVAAATSKKQAASAKLLQDQVKAGQAAVKKAQAALAHLSPRGVVEKWVKEKIVSPAWAILRLEGMGYDRADIDRYIEQWQQEQAKADAKAGGGPSQGTSPPSVPTP